MRDHLHLLGGVIRHYKKVLNYTECFQEFFKDVDGDQLQQSFSGKQLPFFSVFAASRSCERISGSFPALHSSLLTLMASRTVFARSSTCGGRRLFCHLSYVANFKCPLLQRFWDKNLVSFWDILKKKTIVAGGEGCSLTPVKTWSELFNKRVLCLLIEGFSSFDRLKNGLAVSAVMLAVDICTTSAVNRSSNMTSAFFKLVIIDYLYWVVCHFVSTRYFGLMKMHLRPS